MEEEDKEEQGKETSKGANKVEHNTIVLVQSCQEVPSQIFDASTKNNLPNNKVSSGRSLWSDEVEDMEMNNVVNKGVKTA